MENRSEAIDLRVTTVATVDEECPTCAARPSHNGCLFDADLFDLVSQRAFQQRAACREPPSLFELPATLVFSSGPRLFLPLRHRQYADSMTAKCRKGSPYLHLRVRTPRAN